MRYYEFMPIFENTITMVGAALKDYKTGKIYGPYPDHLSIRLASDFLKDFPMIGTDNESLDIHLDHIWDYMDAGRLEDGFIDSTGKFYNRKDAAAAIKFKPTDDDRDWLDAFDLNNDPIIERANTSQSTSKTLYHGTTLEIAKNALRHGLYPSVGEFVKEFYGMDGAVDNLVFAADKNGLMKAISAATYHVGKLLRKPQHKVTSKELYSYGALLVIRNGEELTTQAFDGDFGHPVQVEPDDYYSSESILPDYLLTGNKFKRFISNMVKSGKTQLSVMHPDQQQGIFKSRKIKASVTENDEEHQAALDNTGFWGNRGAGAIIIAADTKRILLPLRSPAVQEPNTWGTWGGAIDSDEDPKTAAIREVQEETGYNGNVLDMIHIHKFMSNTFRYDTYAAIIPTEFNPILNWESSDSRWIEYGDWPSPLHFGLENILNNPNSLRKLKEVV